MHCSWILCAIAPSRYERVRKHLPTITVDYESRLTAFNTSKLALLIEEEPLAHLTPLLLHMISVVPFDWQFMFLGSYESLDHVRSSLPIQRHQSSGKLKFQRMPEHLSYSMKAMKNHMFADITFYDLYLDGAEWLLLFPADSILCTAANTSLNGWLKYDWIGSRRQVFHYTTSKFLSPG